MVARRRFSIPTGQTIARSIISKLNPVADILRDLYTEPFGARPYHVRLVWTRWSGGERSVGTEEVIAEMALLPTPKMSALTGVSITQQMVGADEVGEVLVSQISPNRYNEDQLAGRHTSGADIPDDVSFYYEINFPRPDGNPGIRRRFVLNAPPSLNATEFQWTVRLLRASEDRTRSGDPQG